MAKIKIMNIFLVVLSGILIGLSFNSSLFSWLAWVGLVPFFLVINKQSGKNKLLSGLIFGFIYYLMILFWIKYVTALGLIFLLIYLALYCGLFVIVSANLFNRSWSILTVPAVWVLIEFLKEHIWIGFGWGNLGYSQFQQSGLIQVADLIGTKGISFIIVMVNVCLWQIFISRKLLWKPIIICLAVLAGCAGYSIWRTNDLCPSKEIKFALIQPNIAEAVKLVDENKPMIIEVMTDLASNTSPDSLVIFPEAAWPFLITDLNQEFLSEFVKNINRKVLIGGVEYVNEQYFNCAYLFDQDGQLRGKYQKIKIVPFGEYIPWRKFLSFIPVINEIGDMSQGKKQAMFTYQDKIFSLLICFEDVFPGFVSKACLDRDFLINITNDGWFWGEPQASQHLAIMTMRAIENRISIIRCANTGISGYVDFKGRIQRLKTDKGEVLVQAVKEFTMPINLTGSVFGILGDFFSVLCAMFLIMFLRISRKKQK